MNLRLVGQTFLSAGAGDFPVARWNTGLESPVNQQAGKPALHLGSGAQIANFGPWNLSLFGMVVGVVGFNLADLCERS